MTGIIEVKAPKHQKFINVSQNHKHNLVLDDVCMSTCACLGPSCQILVLHLQCLIS